MQFDMKILQSTPLKTNNYLLALTDGAVLVDASATTEQIQNALEGKKLEAVFLTHSHFDHAINLEKIIKTFGARCYMHERCYEKIHHHEKQFYGDRPFCVEKCEDSINFVRDGDKIEVCGEEFLCIETPGHTDDSMSYVLNDNIFVGDLIFRDGYGRTDLPTGSEKDEEESIEKVLSMPKNFNIFPGHGEQTTVEEELNFWGVM